MKPKYTRVLLKVSGGALGTDKEIFSKESLNKIAENIICASEAGVQVAVVVGGGNIFRGRTSYQLDINRVEADNMGMLATIINSLMLRSILVSKTSKNVHVMSAISMDSIVEPYIRMNAIKYLTENSIVIFGGGIGQPFMSTDYPSVQRAIEIEADIVLMAKEGVDGVYTSNPKDNDNVKRYKELNTSDAIKFGIKVADSAAFILANENNMPMYIFDFNEEKSVIKACFDETNIGTYVSNNCETIFY